MSFVYLHNITIRVSAIISVTDVMYEDDIVREDLLNNEVEHEPVKYGMFTVTLLNGYPITFRGAFGEIENEHENFLKKVKGKYEQYIALLQKEDNESQALS